MEISVKEKFISKKQKPGMLKRILGSLNRNKSFCLMMLPFMILLVVFCYLPFYGITIAFKDFKFNLGIVGSPWVGFDNFRFLLTSSDLYMILRNTVLYNLLFIIIGTIMALIVALMLYEITKKLILKIYQTILFIPFFLSWVVSSYILYAILNPEYGLMNKIFTGLGLSIVDWYSTPELWPFILLLSVVWKNTGYLSIIYFAVLVGIDKGYFEAARIDGASKLKMIWYISLPFLRPIVTIMLLFSIGGIIRSDFGLFYFMPRDIPLLYDTTQTIDTYVYRALKFNGEFGIPAAVGIFQSLVGFIMILATNAIAKKVDSESSLF